MIFELLQLFCLGTMQLSHIDGWITLLCDQKVLYYCSGVFCFADCSDPKGVKVVFGRKCSVASCKPRMIDALHCNYMKATLPHYMCLRRIRRTLVLINAHIL